MIIWTRLGFLVIVVAAAAFVGMEYTVEAVQANESYYQDNAWPKLVAAALGGIAIWFLGAYLNRKADERELHDPTTGEQVVLQS